MKSRDVRVRQVEQLLVNFAAIECEEAWQQYICLLFSYFALFSLYRPIWSLPAPASPKA
jgi:hypothetical protein